MIADAGLLVALERNDRAAWARFRVALERYGPTMVPATVLAQTWRGGAGRQHHLSVALASTRIEPLDDAAAYRVGVLLGRRGSSDVPDGHVAVVAEDHPARPVVTGDRGDIEPLGVAPHRIIEV